MQVTLTNEFHRTSATVRPVAITEGRFKGFHKISQKTARRLHAELCGNKECRCGGNFGERGGVRLQVLNQDYDYNFIIDPAGSNV